MGFSSILFLRPHYEKVTLLNQCLSPCGNESLRMSGSAPWCFPTVFYQSGSVNDCNDKYFVKKSHYISVSWIIFLSLNINSAWKLNKISFYEKWETKLYNTWKYQRYNMQQLREKEHLSSFIRTAFIFLKRKYINLNMVRAEYSFKKNMFLFIFIIIDILFE